MLLATWINTFPYGQIYMVFAFTLPEMSSIFLAVKTSKVLSEPYKTYNDYAFALVFFLTRVVLWLYVHLGLGFWPDAIATLTVDGIDYIVTANEGDDKEFGKYEEKFSSFSAEQVALRWGLDI